MKSNSLRILILLLLLFPVRIFAQDEKSIWIDAKAGLNSIWILNQNAYQNQEMQYSTSFGFAGGLGVSYFYNREWGFNTSPGFVQMGQNYDEEHITGKATRKIKLTYIEVPLLLMRNIPYTKNPTWIAFGPNLMFLTSANQEFKSAEEYPLYNPQNFNTGDIKERFKPVDLAFNFTLSKLYEPRTIDFMMFLLSFNTSIGALDINSKDWQLPKISGKGAGEYGSSHNFYVGLKAGLMFKISKEN